MSIDYRVLENRAKYELLKVVVESAPAKVVALYRRRPRAETRGAKETAPSISQGDLIIPAGYRWDGASGPTIDTANSMLASLVHDACHDLMWRGDLSTEALPAVDAWFRNLLRREGMGLVRRWVWYIGCRLDGGVKGA